MLLNLKAAEKASKSGKTANSDAFELQSSRKNHQKAGKRQIPMLLNLKAAEKSIKKHQKAGKQQIPMLLNLKEAEKEGSGRKKHQKTGKQIKE